MISSTGVPSTTNKLAEAMVYGGGSERLGESAHDIKKLSTRKRCTSEILRSIVETSDQENQIEEHGTKTPPSVVSPVPITPTESFNSSTASSASSSMTSMPSRKTRFSAAVQISTLQAYFVEKTSGEMKEIIAWYSQFHVEDRFAKVDQRKSLPSNAMVYDLDDEDEDDKEYSSSQDGMSESINSKDKSVNASCSRTYEEGPSSPLNWTSKRKQTRRAPGSKLRRVDEIRQQLEAADTLIQNTEYMAEIITELQHKCSAKTNDEVISPVLTTSSDKKNQEISHGITILRKSNENAMLRNPYKATPKTLRNPTQQQFKILEDEILLILVPILLAIFTKIIRWSNL